MNLIGHIVKENRDKRFSSYYATNLKYKISNKRKVEKLKQKQIEKQNLDNWFLNIEIKYNNIKGLTMNNFKNRIIEGFFENKEVIFFIITIVIVCLEFNFELNLPNPGFTPHLYL
jgi:hypothetical protein